MHLIGVYPLLRILVLRLRVVRLAPLIWHAKAIGAPSVIRHMLLPYALLCVDGAPATVMFGLRMCIAVPVALAMGAFGGRPGSAGALAVALAPAAARAKALV